MRKRTNNENDKLTHEVSSGDKRTDRCGPITSSSTTFEDFPSMLSHLMTGMDSKFTLISRQASGHHIVYEIPEGVRSVDDYKVVLTMLGVTLPEAWRPDGGVVAKFRGLDDTTVYVRPSPGESAADAINRSLKENNLFNPQPKGGCHDERT